MNVILLHSNYRRVSATNVAIFRGENKNIDTIMLCRNQATGGVKHIIFCSRSQLKLYSFGENKISVRPV